MEKYYLVRVEETLARTYKVIASSLEEAEEKMEYAYREKGTVILDADDFVCGEIHGREAKDEDLSIYLELECVEDDYFEDLIPIEEEPWSYEDRNYQRLHHEDEPDDSAAWEDDSDRSCKDCPPDECTGHCMSCYYRPV